MRCLVLGAGVVGEAVAWDMTHVAPVADVTLADIDEARLETVRRRFRVETMRLDVTAPGTLEGLAGEHDVVVGALPSRFGHDVLRRLCEAGLRACDVSFMPEDATNLDATAKHYGAVVVHDCGVAPGLSHVLVGDGVARLATVDSVRIDVGGLPETPVLPFFYKAPFAASDVLEEYTRPVQLVRGGRFVTEEPLSASETLEVDGIGPLDSFLTDGLRSLVRTITATSMEERTLRHRGHLPLMVAMRAAGFFDTTPRDVGGQRIAPRDLSAALLFPHWAYAEGERDVTVLRVKVTGVNSDGAATSYEWLLVDRPDPAMTGSLRSMARTTAFPAAIVARWLVDGTLTEPGVHAPETLGLRGLAPKLLDALAVRGVSVSEHRSVRP